VGAVEATSSFTGEPQPVEVFHRGVWYSGVLLGWRHEPDGSCRVRVRCVVDGLRHTAWTELSALRLPEPTPEPALEPRPAPAAVTPPVPEPEHDTRPHRLVPARDVPARPRPPASAAAVPRPRPWPWPDRLDGQLRPIWA
jgi:hypothetical protein